MAIIKIHMHTKQSNENKYKRFIAPRESFVDLDPINKKIVIKHGEYKCKPWDTGISRKNDNSYIQSKKELYSGLCFTSKKQAENFMKRYSKELNDIANNNPIFHHWSIMSVMNKFKPDNTIIYGKKNKPMK